MGQHVKHEDATQAQEHLQPIHTRLRAAILAVPRGTHLLLFVICLILGIALVTQVRAHRSPEFSESRAIG